MEMGKGKMVRPIRRLAIFVIACRAQKRRRDDGATITLGF